MDGCVYSIPYRPTYVRIASRLTDMYSPRSVPCRPNFAFPIHPLSSLKTSINSLTAKPYLLTYNCRSWWSIGHQRLLVIALCSRLLWSFRTSWSHAVSALLQCLASNCCEAGLSSSSPAGSRSGLGEWCWNSKALKRQNTTRMIRRLQRTAAQTRSDGVKKNPRVTWQMTGATP